MRSGTSERSDGIQGEVLQYTVFGQDGQNLQILATFPNFRRRGCATTLARWGMDQAAKDKVILTLNASPQGLALYESLGFRTLGCQKSQVPGESEFIVDTAMVYEPDIGERRHMESLELVAEEFPLVATHKCSSLGT